MTSIKVFNANNEAVGEVELDDAIFAVPFKEHLLHAVVRKQHAARRQGTHCVKRRSDVSGGGRKPYKQKGTGRARQGSTRSPHFRGGGVVFGPTPRSYDFKINKKEMRAALCSAISKRVADGDMIVLDELAYDAPKTKNVVGLMGAFDMSSAVLLVDDAAANVERSARNLSSVTVLSPEGLNVYDVLLRDRLVTTRSALDALTKRLGA